MYSAKINGEPTTFGTSGMLYQSNKLMYDRTTNSIWNQFTGEPVVGPLADSGIKLDFFPSVLTTWEEWLAEHPDTTVLNIDTGVYSPAVYAHEWEPNAIYFDYFSSPRTMFPVFNRDEALLPKETVIGVGINGDYKAYPVSAFADEPVINDVVGGQEIVIAGSSTWGTGRVYERGGRTFAEEGDGPAGLGRSAVDHRRGCADPGGRRRDAGAHTDDNVVLARVVLVPPGYRPLRGSSLPLVRLSSPLSG